MCSERSEDDEITRRRNVGRAAHDALLGATSSVDRHEAQFVARRVRLDLADGREHDAVANGAKCMRSFDFEAGGRELLRDLRRGRREPGARARAGTR